MLRQTLFNHRLPKLLAMDSLFQISTVLSKVDLNRNTSRGKLYVDGWQNNRKASKLVFLLGFLSIHSNFIGHITIY